MATLFFLVAFIFGTFIGSFLNVVIFRMNTGRGLGGRSHCGSCGKTLGAHELIPVASYVAQGGKCRTCKARISLQYPIVELLMGVVSALIFWKFHALLFVLPNAFALAAAFSMIIFGILVVIFFYDIRHKIIPDSLAYTFAILAFFAPLVFSHIAGEPFHFSWMMLFSGPLIALPFLILWVVSGGKWIGMGDAKLAIGIGYLLGIAGGAAALLFGFWLGALVGVVLLVAKGRKYTMKSEMPFAPFLIIGLAIVFFTGVNISSILSFLMR